MSKLLEALKGTEPPPCDYSNDGEPLCEYWALCAKHKRACLTFARYSETGGQYRRPAYDIPSVKTFWMIEREMRISLRELRKLANKLGERT